MSRPFEGRWVQWRPQLGQGSTDALANWEAKARAKVEWETTMIRRPDNTAIHTVTPILTCVKCHPLTDDHGATISYSVGDQSQVRLLCERVMEDWKHRHRGHYELIAYEPRFGGYGPSYTLSIMVYYRLGRCLIQDCAGQGPSLRAAKSVAAQKLLESGHCTVQLN